MLGKPPSVLDALSSNVGVTFVGATPTDAPNAGDVYATRNGVKVITSYTGQWALRAPAYQLWSAGLRYQLPGQSATTHSFGINVNNAFNRTYKVLVSSYYSSIGFQSAAYAPPRTYGINAQLRF
mgnify:CR=1 FL=1